jgi:hypothetical protein
VYAVVDDEDEGAGVDEDAEEVVNAAELETDVGLAAAVVDEEGRAVVDGWTYVMDVPAATQPMPLHWNPGRQQPPLEELGHAV